MRAIKIPYPAPPDKQPWVLQEQTLLRSVGMVIDFPDRKVSYAIFAFGPKLELRRYADAVRKSVELQSPGHEPRVLEIRLSQ